MSPDNSKIKGFILYILNDPYFDWGIYKEFKPNIIEYGIEYSDSGIRWIRYTIDITTVFFMNKTIIQAYKRTICTKTEKVISIELVPESEWKI